MSPRRPHDHDAGGDPEVLDRKAGLRIEVWDALQEAGAARFPGAHHRIPNFVGAEAAAECLRETTAWRDARTIKCNPDSPQWPVRQRALEDGKIVVMAVPRLADDPPFLLLDPDRIAESPRQASSIKGAARNADPVAVGALDPVDLVVQGCVATDRRGARLGKGGGFADLEFAIAAAAGIVTAATTVATTVHPVQVLDDGRIPLSDHDVRVDLIGLPDGVIEVSRSDRRLPTIDWDELTEEKIAAIPLLQSLRPAP